MWRVTFLFVVGNCFFTTAAHAGVVFNSPWAGEVSGYTSDLNTQVADDFIIQSPTTILAATWDGLYIPAIGTPPPPPLGTGVTFRFRLYGNVPEPPVQSQGLSNRPAQSPFADLTVLARARAIETVAFPPYPGTNGYRVTFEANLPSPVVLSSAGTYWASILGTNREEGFLWMWGQHGDAVFAGIGVGDGSTWYAISSPRNPVFALYDSPIPEPASLAWLPAGLIVLRRWRIY